MPKEKFTEARSTKYTDSNMIKINHLCDELEREQSWVINKVLEIGFNEIDCIKKFRGVL